MNILTLEATAGGTIIAGSEPRVLRDPVDALLLGVRPEDVTIGGEGVPARVTNIEFMGADTMIACAVGSQFITASVPGKAALKPGEAVHLAWRSDAMHFFDVASGRRRDDVAADAIRDTNNSDQNVFA